MWILFINFIQTYIGINSIKQETVRINTHKRESTESILVQL